MLLFRRLDKEEEIEFRQWAKENYQPLSEINGAWHPVVQDECRKMDEERGSFLKLEIVGASTNS